MTSGGAGSHFCAPEEAAGLGDVVGNLAGTVRGVLVDKEWVKSPPLRQGLHVRRHIDPRQGIPLLHRVLVHKAAIGHRWRHARTGRLVVPQSPTNGEGFPTGATYGSAWGGGRHGQIAKVGVTLGTEMSRPSIMKVTQWKH